ncbi:NF-kappa-B essential modulator-like isoform X2 [Coccinella septempunctata]|uniref:NF-kappa-B essential modulator-like isoform X2 n=1 Tax=Coccinella septempunctata TaxID=41139 RepID=UPI001D06937C|nr:NF-kappa-B essential modulator-like isoform X2 [Coccinella septempunctata]
MSLAGEFKIPEGPKPMATMESEDEESFVVLGQSLMPEVDLSFKNLTIESIKKEPIEEGKQLMKNMELSQLEMSGLSRAPVLAEVNKAQDLAISLPSIASHLAPTEIQEKIEMLIDENVKLREIIIKNNAAMETQHEKIVAWKEEVHNTHLLHKEKFAEAKKYITNLVQEKAYLTGELEKNKEIRKLQETELFRLKEELKQVSTQTNSQYVPLVNKEDETQQEIENLKRELNEVVNKKKEMEEFLKIVYAQKDTLKKEKDEMELFKNNFIFDLQKELQNRDDHIVKIKNEFKDKEETMNKRISALTTEIKSLKTQASESVNLKEDLENVRKQLMASQENITCLLQTNGILEAQLNVEKEKVKELKKLETMKDDYFALQQQLEIYKADFEEERRLKENYKEENKQLSSDFQQIQKRNGELQDELEVLKERGWEFVNRDHRTSSTSSASAENRYMCPICKFGFLSYQALVNHVDRCMNLNASLP